MSLDKIKKLEGSRKYIFYGCLIIMIVMFTLLFTMRETLFTQTITIKYPDSCIEIYKNGNLTTDICTIGRQMKKEQEDNTMGNRIINNINYSNIKINGVS